VIHLERVALPDGLRALAYRDARGNLVIYVSRKLDAAAQRAAVVQAVRAARRAGWRAGLPPAGIALLLGIRALLGRAAGALRARPLAWGAAAATTALGASAAGVFITAVPHHSPPQSAPRPGPGSVTPLPPPGQQPAHTGRRAAASPAPASRPSPAGQPAAAGQPTPAGGSSPAPSPSPAPTQPGPSPSPSPSGGVCVVVLGIRLCVPPVTLSAGG
jgi:hypothetical protein